MALRVVAHVEKLSPQAIARVQSKASGTEPRVPGFPEWLDVDHPRSAWLTEEIRQVASEFGVADETKVHRTFKTLPEALKARDGAKITFGVEVVEVPEAKEPEKAEEPKASK